MQEMNGLKPAPRAGHTAQLYNKEVYIFGGKLDQDGEKIYFNDIHCIDTLNFEWKSIMPRSSIPPNRAHHGSCIIDNKMFIFGGKVKQQYLDDLWIFHLDTQIWSKVDTYGFVPRGISHMGFISIYVELSNEKDENKAS